MADRGWPLTFKRLRDILNRILKTIHGDKFEGVGKQFVYRFVTDHSDELKTYWTRSLESQRGQAVNPSTHAAWMKLLGDSIEKYQFAPENIYGADESGFNPHILGRARAIGRTKKKALYQQNDAPRETTTVMVTICADGTALPPAIVYKGDGYQVSWRENNPLNAL
jgi:hypothetical protein